MILQIDGKYFNPDQVRGLEQNGPNVIAYFSLGKQQSFITFENWKVEDLADEINKNKEEFYFDIFRRALDEHRKYS